MQYAGCTGKQSYSKPYAKTVERRHLRWKCWKCQAGVYRWHLYRCRNHAEGVRYHVGHGQLSAANQGVSA